MYLPYLYLNNQKISRFAPVIIAIIFLYLLAFTWANKVFAATAIFYDTVPPSNYTVVSPEACGDPIECANTAVPGDPNQCGQACPNSGDGFGNAWTKYGLTCVVDSFNRLRSYYNRESAVCSIGDKCHAGETGLHYGSCTCGVEGPAIYKYCCSTQGQAQACTTAGVPQDNYPPPEGQCQGGSVIGDSNASGYVSGAPCVPNVTCSTDTSNPPNPYTQCGQTGGCTNNYAANHTVSITRNLCTDGTNTYSCTDAGVIQGQCGNNPPPQTPSFTGVSANGSSACYLAVYSATITWNSNAAPLPSNDPGCGGGFWVDVSTDSAFNTYSNTCVQGSHTLTTNGHDRIWNSNGSFSFNQGTTYYTRVFNGTHSGTASLAVPPQPCAGNASCTSLTARCDPISKNCNFTPTYIVNNTSIGSYQITLNPGDGGSESCSSCSSIAHTYASAGTFNATANISQNDGTAPTSCSTTVNLQPPSNWNGPLCSGGVFSGCNITGQPRCTDYGNSNYTSSGWTQAQWNTCNTACSKTNPNDYCILPSCTISANPPLGPSPLTTNLSVAVDTTLMPPSKVSYWDFGDGKTEFNQSLTNTHTYTSSIPPQTFNPSFKAVDSITNTDLSQSCSTPVGIIGSDTNPITAPTVSTPACINPGYSGSGVTISWTNPGVTWVDISRANDVSFTTPYYHESISGLTSTTAPNGFNATDGSGPLILNPNTTYTYYVRTFNGVRNSRLASFSIPSCSAPPSVIPPPSPSCTIYDPPDDTPLVSPQADGKVKVSYSFPGPANQRPGINLFRSSSLGFLPAGTLIGNQVGNFGRSFHTNPNQNQIYYYQLQNSNGSKPETSSNTAGIAVPKLDPEVGNSCTNTPGQRLAVIQSAQQISSSPFKLTFKLIYTVSAYLSGCGRECTPTLVPPYLQLTRSGGIPAYLSWDSAISRTSRCVADFVFRQQGCGKTEYTAVYELALPPGTNDSLIISSYSNGQCSYQRAGGSAELTVSTDPGSAKQLILPQISATYLISGEQAQLGQISWNQTTDGQQSQVFVNSDRWSGTAVIDPATSLNYNNGLWTLTAVDDLSNLPSATYYYGAQIIRNGWCKEVKSDQAAFAWTKPTSAWIQTTGGDIYSNTINTPGGP